VISSVGRPTQDNTNRINADVQTPMPRVEFDLKILVSERAKIFHTLDRATTVIDVTVLCNFDLEMCEADTDFNSLKY
jgi:hypothetical protein